MKIRFKIFAQLLIIIMLLFTSCRTEETEIIETPTDEQLKANSAVANLMKNIATNDGSFDNIIDNSNCFNVILPITVVANGTEVDVNSPQDFIVIEAIFDEFDNDIDILQIQFPITVILTDYSEVILNSIAELNALSITCNGENEIDIDIECIDFQYPISATIFNTDNEIIDTIIINNDNDLYNFIININVNDIVSIDFPITMILPDGSTITITNFIELENTIDTYKDTCDEDDDNDYNDDDCDNCSDNDLITLLTDCDEWTVDKLELNDNDIEDNYIGFFFTFLNDNTISVISGSSTFNGTWNAAGVGNNITVNINIPSLPDFNNNWILHEIEQSSGEKKVDLRLNDDRLRFESDCVMSNNIISSVSSASVIEGNDLQHNVVVTNSTIVETYAFSIVDVTTSSSDYTLPPSFSNGVTFNNVSGLISVPSGVSNFSVTVTTIDDTEVESIEIYTISIGGINATGTITDNDSAGGTVSSVSSASGEEGNNLLHNVEVTNLASIEVYAFSFVNNTTSNSDYSTPPTFSNGVTFDSASGLISVPSGVSNFTVTVATIDDTIVESTETYTIIVGGINATGTIIDNDVAQTLSTILIDGLWFVASYTEDGDDQTTDYNGYQIDFINDGTVIADNGTPINGTWNAQNGDTELILNFASMPFDEFNDNWDVISISNTQVIIQDISGGGGGTDTLTLEKL